MNYHFIHASAQQSTPTASIPGTSYSSSPFVLSSVTEEEITKLSHRLTLKNHLAQVKSTPSSSNSQFHHLYIIHTHYQP